MKELFIDFLYAFGVSLLAIPLILLISKKFGLYDRIDERKIHNGNISRLGGLAIFLGFIVTFFLKVYQYYDFKFNENIYLLALLVAFLVGFIDDFTNIKARYKLLAQLLAGFLVAYSGLAITQLKIAGDLHIAFGPLSYVITILWVVMFMNAINLLDGMDGLASGVVLIADIFLLVMALLVSNYLVASVAAIMAGAILGFYIFNFPPAKIFMGDGGAYFLGFMYATLPLMGIKKASVATLFIFPLVLLLLPLADIAQVMVKRLKLGYNIFIADKNHIHHRLMGLGLSIKGILMIQYTYTIIFGLVSVLFIHLDTLYSIVLFLLIFLLMFISLYLLNSAEKIIENNKNFSDSEE